MAKFIFISLCKAFLHKYYESRISRKHTHQLRMPSHLKNNTDINYYVHTEKSLAFCFMKDMSFLQQRTQNQTSLQMYRIQCDLKGSLHCGTARG